MKKQIIALIAVIAMMATMLTIPVGAEVFVNDTFDTPPASGIMPEGWKAYSATMEGNIQFIDGAVKMLNIPAPNAQRPFWERKYEVPGKNHIILVDVMVESTTTSPSWQLRVYTSATSNQRVIYNSIKANVLGEDVWNTVMIVVENNGKNYSLYYKPRDVVNAAWKKFSITTPELSDTDVEKLTGTFSLGWDCNPAGDGFWVDNFRVFTGDFVNNFDGFKLGSTKVEDVMEINAAGTLKADYEIYTDDVSFVEGSTANTYELQSTPLKTIMVSFDKNMRMLDCDVKDVSLTVGPNVTSNQLTISDEPTADGYYGNITDGGYVGLYLWKGMQPFGEAIELN